MSAVLDTKGATPATEVTEAPVAADASAGRVHRGIRALRQACRQIVGIPDYERYLGHMAEHHPGEPVLSREKYFAQAIDRKYGRSGPRCC